MPLFKREKTLAEIEEDTEKAEAEERLTEKELSITQKKEAIARLKERGLTPKHFENNWQKIINWLKTH